VDFDGSFAHSEEVEARVEMAAASLVRSPYPNPSNPHSQFSFAVRDEQYVRVLLFDVLGRSVGTLFEGVVAAGETRRVSVRTAGLASGMYFVQLRGVHFRPQTVRYTLVK
jgi:hypothetical protein